MDTKNLERINLRLSKSEARRLAKVVDYAEKRTLGFAPVSQIVKELLGITPYRLLNESLRKQLLQEEDHQKGQK